MHKLTEISAELAQSADARAQLGSSIKVAVGAFVVTLLVAAALLSLL